MNSIMFCISAVEIKNPQYLITSPAVYRVDQEEKVTVLLIGSKSCQVQVRLKPQGRTLIAVRASGTFKPGERGTLKLRVKLSAKLFRKKETSLIPKICNNKLDACEMQILIFVLGRLMTILTPCLLK